MAATNYRGEMMAAEESDPSRRKRRKPGALPLAGNDALERGINNSTGVSLLPPDPRSAPPVPQTTPRPVVQGPPLVFNPSMAGPAPQAPAARPNTQPYPPAPLPTDGRIINSGQPRYQAGQTVTPGQPSTGMYAKEPPAYATPKPAIPPVFKPSGPADATPAPAAPAAPTGQTGGFAGMGDRSMRDMRPDPETMAMNDTEQGRRDLAMLRKRRNLADAALMGSSNRFSKFYNPGQTPDQRAELILSKEGMNQELATAQRAANPPRYETDPNSERAIRGRESLAGNLDKILMDEARATQLPGGQPGPVDRSGVDQRVSAFRDSIAPKAKSPEQMLAEETAQNRQQQAVAQAATDAQKRALPRERADQMTAAEFDRLLMTEKAGAAAEKARGEGVGLDNEIRKTDSQARLAESQGLLKQTQTARALQDSQYDPATSIEVAQRTMKGVASRFGSGALNRGKADVNIIGRSADEDIRDLEMMDSMVVGPLEAFASADPARARRDASMILNTMPPTTSAGTYAEAGGLLPTTPGVRRVVEKLNAIRARLQAIASGSGSPTTS